MIEPIFDHERLDVYRLAIDYVSSSYRIAKSLRSAERDARDQWLRAAQAISPAFKLSKELCSIPVHAGRHLIANFTRHTLWIRGRPAAGTFFALVRKRITEL